jgi:hypothetical protein
MVLSSRPEAIRPPSVEKATDPTSLTWPLSVCVSVPVETSQILIVLSRDPEAAVGH